MGTALNTMSGGCLCGAIRFTAKPEKPEMDVCHCGMCRKWSGGVFMAVPCSDVAIEDETELGAYQSSDWALRQFCTRCGSSLFWRLREGQDHVAVAYQSFDDSGGLNFVAEIFVDEKPALYDFAGERPRLTGAEFLARMAAQEEGLT